MLGTTEVSLITVYGFLGCIILFQVVLLIVANKLLIARRELREIHSYLGGLDNAKNATKAKSIIPEEGRIEKNQDAVASLSK